MTILPQKFLVTFVDHALVSWRAYVASTSHFFHRQIFFFKKAKVLVFLRVKVKNTHKVLPKMYATLCFLEEVHMILKLGEVLK